MRRTRRRRSADSGRTSAAGLCGQRGRCETLGEPRGQPRAAVRRDGLLEPRASSPARTARHASRSRPRWPCREYRFTARGVTGSDTLVGQTTADLAVRKDFFVDLKVPAALDPGRQAPVRRPRSTTSASPGRSTLRLAVYAGEPRAGLSRRRSSSRATASTRSCSSRSRSPTATVVRLTLTAERRRGEGRAGGRGADPPLGRAGVRLGLGHGERRRDGLRRPAGRAGRTRAPRCSIVVSPTLRRMLIELALGADAYPLAPATPPIASHLPAAAEHDGRPGVATCSRRPRRLAYLRDGPGADGPRGRSG